VGKCGLAPGCGGAGVVAAIRDNKSEGKSDPLTFDVGAYDGKCGLG
jgi:hypothetical protein